MSDESRIAETLAAIEAATNADAVEAIRIEALGKQGWISQALKTLGKMSPEERQTMGPAINGLKNRVTDALTERRTALRDTAIEARLAHPALKVEIIAVAALD